MTRIKLLFATFAQLHWEPEAFLALSSVSYYTLLKAFSAGVSLWASAEFSVWSSLWFCKTLGVSLTEGKV